MKLFQVLMAITGEIPVMQSANSPEEASLEALEEANRQFPGALKIEVLEVKEI